MKAPIKEAAAALPAVSLPTVSLPLAGHKRSHSELEDDAKEVLKQAQH
jgi:hypothetical protein